MDFENLFEDKPRADLHYIDGKGYHCLKGRIDISKVNFWEKNPRILLELEQTHDDEHATQDAIYELMINYDDTIILQSKIVKEGAIKQPILVAIDPITKKITAFDGNTRLAIAKKFFLINHEISRQHIEAIFLVDDSLNLDILEYEVAYIHLDPSMNDWDGHKKARFYWDRVNALIRSGEAKTPGTAAKKVASKFSSGITKSVVEHAFNIVEFMKKYNIGPEEQKKQFGYWDPYIKTGVVSQARKFFNNKENLIGNIDNPIEDAFDLVMIDKVRNGKRTGEVTSISAGGDGAWRTEITHLAKSFAVTNRKDIIFGMLNGDSLQDAVSAARESGAADEAYNKIKKFQQFLDDPDTTKKLRKLVRKHEDLRKLIKSIETSSKLTYKNIREITSQTRKKRTTK